MTRRARRSLVAAAVLAALAAVGTASTASTASTGPVAAARPGHVVLVKVAPPSGAPGGSGPVFWGPQTKAWLAALHTSGN